MFVYEVFGMAALQAVQKARTELRESAPKGIACIARDDLNALSECRKQRGRYIPAATLSLDLRNLLLSRAWAEQ
jgi:hypothetical protein